MITIDRSSVYYNRKFELDSYHKSEPDKRPRGSNRIYVPLYYFFKCKLPTCNVVQ